MTHRIKIAYILLGLASWLKAVSKKLLKDDFIMIDVLSVPDFFIIDGVITQDYLTRGRLFVDISWKEWPMPQEFIDKMHKLKRRRK